MQPIWQFGLKFAAKVAENSGRRVLQGHGFLAAPIIIGDNVRRGWKPHPFKAWVGSANCSPASCRTNTIFDSLARMIWASHINNPVLLLAQLVIIDEEVFKLMQK